MEKWKQVPVLVAALMLCMACSGQTWSGDTLSWDLTDTSATLNAAAAGTSLLSICPDSPGAAFDWRWRWVQALAGSSANRSTITLHAADSTFLCSIALGATGSDDPLVVTLPDTVLLCQPGLWASGLDATFRLLKPPGASTSTLFIRPTDSLAYTALAAVAGTPACWSFQAWFTSSNTQAFGFYLDPNATFIPDTLAPFPISNQWVSDSLIRIAFNERLAAPPDAWLEDTGLLCQIASENEGNVVRCLAPDAAAVGHPIPLYLSQVCDTLGNCADRLITTLFLPPHATQPGDVVVTEIMADPTPSQGFPEVEWIEWTNASDRIVDVRHLYLQDATDLSGVEPLAPWDGLLEPHARCVLSPSHTVVAAGVQQALLLDIGSFTDAGELLEVQRADGTVIDAVQYDRAWWQGVPGGTSIALRHAGACGLESHWAPETPASPGTGAETTAPDVPLAVTAFHPLHARGGRIEFSCELDPLASGSLTWREGGVPLEPNGPQSALWTGTVPAGQPLALTITGLRPCLQRWNAEGPWHHVDSIAEFPKASDAAVTEIAVRPPVGWPGLSPFVEWTNLSEATWEISGVHIGGITSTARQLAPGASALISVDLPNEAGSIVLLDGAGNTLESFAYTSCWQEDRQAADEGIAWVRLDPHGPAGDGRNWAGSRAPLGCSPGWLESRVPWVDTVPPSLLAWVELEGQIHARFSEPVLPDSTAFPGDENGFLWHWPAAPGTSVTCRDFAGNAVTTTIEELDESPRPWRLNEIGAWLPAEDEPFIETLAEGSGWTSTFELVWTSTDEPFPYDWAPVTSERMWVPAGVEIAWARCPERLSSPFAIPAELPSLYGDRRIQLGRVAGGERVLLDSVWSDRDRFDPQRALDEGVSWERFHAAPGAWAACLSGTTPGAPNSQSGLPARTDSPLEVAPRTCVPGTSSWGQVGVHWQNSTPEALHRLVVMDAVGREVRRLFEPGGVLPVAGGRASWFWDGRDMRGVAAEPGSYWVVAMNEAGHAIETRAVVVAPRIE